MIGPPEAGSAVEADTLQPPHCPPRGLTASLAGSEGLTSHRTGLTLHLDLDLDLDIDID